MRRCRNTWLTLYSCHGSRGLRDVFRRKGKEERGWEVHFGIIACQWKPFRGNPEIVNILIQLYFVGESYYPLSTIVI